MNRREVLYSAGLNDEVHTPGYAVAPLIQFLPEHLTYWCPFDEEHSEFVRQLSAAGRSVVFSHIARGQDFYQYQPQRWDVMVSNPPFTGKAKVFERALSFGKPFALMMTLTWLNDSAPKRLFRERPLQLLMFEERIQFLGQANKVTFSTAYFCCDLLPCQIVMARLKDFGKPGRRVHL